MPTFRSDDPTIPAVDGEHTTNGTALVGNSAQGVGVHGVNDAPQGSSTKPKYACGVWGESTNGYGVFGSSDNNVGVHAISTNNDGIEGISASSQHTAVVAHNIGGGFAFWGNSDSDNGTGMFVRGKRTAAQFVQTDNGSDADGLQSTAATRAHAAVAAHNTGGGFAFWGDSDSDNGTGMFVRGKRLAAQFVGNVEIAGDLTILNGKDIRLADFAEEFDLSDEAGIEPGSVVVLSDDGAVHESHIAYDKKVAGVVSGAGNFRSAITLDREASRENRTPVALRGKVYCKVDAHYGAIEVGDLLTTSPTAGHAMKATDPLKAFGAVIGKALQPLTHGQGLIPILIALQ